jgi:hypothetical protein
MSENIVDIKLFKPGTSVSYEGRDYVVEYIVISRRSIKVSLLGGPKNIDSELIVCNPTPIDLSRRDNE